MVQKPNPIPNRNPGKTMLNPSVISNRIVKKTNSIIHELQWTLSCPSPKWCLSYLSHRDHQHVRTRTFVSVVRLSNVRGKHFHVIEHIFQIGLFDFLFLPKNKILIYFSENPIFDFAPLLPPLEVKGIHFLKWVFSLK